MKRILLILLVLLLVCACAPPRGDVNRDGKADAIDLLLIQKHVLGQIVLDGVRGYAADVNRDGFITEKDVEKLRCQLIK